MGHLGRPADIGKVAALLSSEDAGWITGQVNYADGGVSLMNSEIPPEIRLGQ
jgi:enoyl-[acyl-carrier-protein] reductase (NADH)